VSISLADSGGFVAFATIFFGFLAFINALALVLGIVLGHVGFATVGLTCGFIIFGVLTLIYARRWRRSRKQIVPPTESAS
jgi:membrane protein implicated in regulation of membrane protease activity